MSKPRVKPLTLCAHQFEQIANESSTNTKQILMSHFVSMMDPYTAQTFKYLLNLTYNPFKKYGIRDLSMVSPNQEDKTIDNETLLFNQFTRLIYELETHNINDELRQKTINFLNRMPEPYHTMFKQIILKDLRLNCGATLINKALGNIIPTFEVQLAKNIEAVKDKQLQGNCMAVTEKLDGMRLIAIRRGRNAWTFYSRQGKEVEGLVEVEQALSHFNCQDMVLDGELLYNDDSLSTADRYKATMKEARKKGTKKNLTFHVFDGLELDDFEAGGTMTAYGVRRQQLIKLFTEVIQAGQYSPSVKLLPILYMGDDLAEVHRIVDHLVANGSEGGMINLVEAPYMCKRNGGLLKVKQFKDADVRVCSIVEGTGKNRDKLGSIVVEFEHNGDLHRCEVGSGFSDEEREEYWQHPEMLNNKIVTVKYFEVTQNKSGDYGLRFPVWLGRIRHDKTEISMH